MSAPKSLDNAFYLQCVLASMGYMFLCVAKMPILHLIQGDNFHSVIDSHIHKSICPKLSSIETETMCLFVGGMRIVKTETLIL